MGQLSVTVASHPGRVRSSNQDQLVVSNMIGNGHKVKGTKTTLDAAELVAVIDGMGGHAGGEVAAGVAAAVLASCWPAPTDPARLAELIEAANTAIYDEMDQRPTLAGMGATCATAVLCEDRWLVGNVGDARIYSIADGYAVLLTTDDRLPNGKLSQSLGGLRIRTPVSSHVAMHDMAEHQRLLLCTDGLSDTLSLSEIQDILCDSDDMRAIGLLMDASLDQGAQDNVTMALLTPML